MRVLTSSRTRSVVAVAATFVAVAAGGGTACADAATPKPLPAGTKIVVTGNGYGHGHGMSQWGAEGAAKKGRTYNQILRFYYPGTKQGRAGGNVRVLLTEDTTPDLVVRSRTKLVAKSLATGRTWNLPELRPHATRFRFRPAVGGRTALAFLKGGAWHRMARLKGDMTFYAKGQPIRVYFPHGSAQYRGTLRSTAPVKGKWNRDTVNVLSLDNYLKGVVPSEAYPSWHVAALRAQAIAARSYAVFERGAASHGYYDVVDTTGDQVYHGYAAEVGSTNAAVTSTTGLVRTYRGKVAFTQFAASNGGYLLDGGKPYLVSKPDPYDTKASGDTNLGWKATLTLKHIRSRWPSAGGIVKVSVTQHAAGKGNPWVTQVTVVGTKRTYTITGEGFRSWAGLKSSSFTLRTVKPSA